MNGRGRTLLFAFLAVVIICGIALSIHIFRTDEGAGENLQPLGAGRRNATGTARASAANALSPDIQPQDSFSEPAPPRRDDRPSGGAEGGDMLSPGASQEELPDMVSAEVEKFDLATTQAAWQAQWRRQDQMRDTWPDYEQVRERLRAELGEQIDLDTASSQQLVRMARMWRERFWDAGGLLSRDSYDEVYKSRLLLELAHQRAPGDHAVTGELVETLQSANPPWRVGQPPDGETTSGILYWDRQAAAPLRELRSEQFSRAKEEIAQGRAPTEEDLKCATDLAALLQHEDTTEAARVVDWLLRHSDEGHWGAYEEVLHRWHSALSTGSMRLWYLYQYDDSDFVRSRRWRRHLPSFKGPVRPWRRAFLLLTFASDKETPPLQKTPCLLHFWQSCPFLLTCKGQ